MAVKLTFEAENETHLLDVIRAVALNEREQGLILDQQIERLEADNARRKPEPVLWMLVYGISEPRYYATQEEAHTALNTKRDNLSLLGGKLGNYVLTPLYEC